jgi:2-polyprenyl-3-methyl-5-hydroxy-6-metoxy-1,4-benzoquinol methylase
VYYNTPNLLGAMFYRGAYHEAGHGKDLRARYQRIMALPPEDSDNRQRVRRILRFLREHGSLSAGSRILDVGSGLAVFAAEMGRAGLRCSCIDPDPSAIAHARTVTGVEHAHVGTLDDYRPRFPFDLVTLNKVLEHVLTPVQMLARARELLSADGVIYLEVPDGDGALRCASPVERGEFHAEHCTIFTKSALEYLIRRAGLRCLEASAINDPSGKCTLYAFCASAPSGQPVDKRIDGCTDDETVEPGA